MKIGYSFASRAKTSLRHLLGTTVIAAAMSMSAQPAQASLISDVASIVYDPLKLSKAGGDILETVRRVEGIMNQASKLEAATNTDITNRLQQAQGIIDSVQSYVDKDLAITNVMVANWLAQLNVLETQLYADIVRVLDKVQCVTWRATHQDVAHAVADALNTLGKANIKVKLLGATIIDVKTNQVTVKAADQAYLSIRDGYLARLKTLDEHSPAYTIVSYYGAIAQLAADSMCAYKEGAAEQVFLDREYMQYHQLSMMWTTIPVDPEAAR